MAIDGRSYEAVGEKIVHSGNCWVEEVYLKGEHPAIGSPVNGLTGKETVRKTIIPESLVNPAIKVNGKSNAILQHRVAPEFRHLIQPPIPAIAPLERLLEGIEFNLLNQNEQPATHIT